MTHDPAKPDDLRAIGGMVSAHNDFVMAGKRMTFWLISFCDPERPERMISFEAEGDDDAQALDRIRQVVRSHGF